MTEALVSRFVEDNEKPDDLNNKEANEINEVEQTLFFDEYRHLCDEETDAFRRIGILDANAYTEAITDSRTMFCTLEGNKIPALVPIEYEARYSKDRTKQLTGEEEVMLLALPLSLVREGMLMTEEIAAQVGDSPERFAILIEEPTELQEGDRQADHQRIAQLLEGIGSLKPHEFIDERLDHLEKNRTAWMGIFSFSVDSTREIDPTILQLPVHEAVLAAWQAYCAEKGIETMPTEGTNETYLFSAEQLQAKPEIVGALWNISEIGFGQVLGKFHPISMEVTKNFFDEHIMSPGVLTAVRYRNGEPVCFGFMAPNMDHNDWLDCDSTVLGNDLDSASQRGEQVAHFFELISKGGKEVGLSPSVLGLLLELAARTRERWHIIFESTNLSETYIPRIAEHQVRRSANLQLSQPIEMLSQLDYWYLAPEED